MKNRQDVKIIIGVLLVAFLLILAGGPAYAGKSWSRQAFSREKGIVVIGNDDKYATVFGLDIKNQKKLWSVGMPGSGSVEIIIEGDMVYLIGAEDIGLKKTLIAHQLQGKKTIWKTKIDKYVRSTDVYNDNDFMYFGATVPYRNMEKVMLYSINKANGEIAWSTFSCYGSYIKMLRAENKDFILVLKKEEMARVEEDGRTEEKIVESIYLTRIDYSTGEIIWNLEIDGKFARDPVIEGDNIYIVNKVKSGEEETSNLYSVNLVSGEINYDYPIPSDFVLFSEPVASEGRVFLFSNDAKLLCLDAQADSGADPMLWEYKAQGQASGKPVAMDNQILIFTVQPDRFPITSEIISLDRENGEFRWSRKNMGVPEYPVYRYRNKLIYGIHDRGTLVLPESPMMIAEALLLFQTHLKSDAMLSIQPTLPMEAFLMKYVQAKKELRYKYTPGFRIVAMDLDKGTVEWINRHPGKQENPMVIKGNTIYTTVVFKEKRGENLENVHFLIALNGFSGRKKWILETKSVINTGIHFQGKDLYFGTKNGKILWVNRNTGEIAFKFNAGKDNELDSDIAATDKFLGFATQKSKYFIINKAGKKQKVWNMKPYFAYYKTPIFIGAIILGGAISWFIYHARRGKEMFIRKIAGLNAIDEAVGRATEMGKPVLYVTGLADVDDIQTLASLSILGHIAQKSAEYDAPIIVPCCRSVVMSTAQEVVKESYMKAGRPDTFRSENIYYLTDDQFGYVAGVDGIMVRERPAANFYMGKFYAESLILAETGHSTGAIQIAGTAEAAQLPFFVAACDYTLIGEELFAASAYLSEDPMQIGSLKGQDFAKALILFAIIAGCILMTFGQDWVKVFLSTQ